MRRMSRNEVIALALSALLGATTTTLVSLILVRGAIAEIRNDMDAHIHDSEGVHEAMAAFMSAGPRYSRVNGMRLCDAVQKISTAVSSGVDVTCE